MNLPLHIARRYLFAKKSHTAINVISIVSVIGITVATAALVCALSVFNGFTDLVAASFSAFDPELQITPTKGKVFDPSTPEISKVKQLNSIDFVSESLEENALLKFEDRQKPVIMKGVSPEFINLAGMSKLMLDGEFVLRQGDVDNAVIGAGLAMTLGAGSNFRSPLEIYVPKRNMRINPSNAANAFTVEYAYVSGVFALNQAKYDDEMLIVSINLAREILEYENEVSSLDVKVKNGESVDAVKSEIKSILGDNFSVKDRFEQQEDMYRMVNVEKWVTFLILALILIIAVFNIIGSLSMLILDKSDDIQILQNLGANNKLIARIFLFEGWMISFFGAITGLIIGVLVCLLQQHFGFIKLGSAGAFVVDAYPVSVQWGDVLLILITVSIIGFVAVLYPVNALRKKMKQ